MVKHAISLLTYFLFATISLIFGAQQPNKQNISPKNLSAQKNVLEVKREYFRCTQCDQSFKTNEDLALHKKQHDGQKLFSCDLCSQIFLSPDDYTNHYLLSHKP